MFVWWNWMSTATGTRRGRQSKNSLRCDDSRSEYELEWNRKFDLSHVEIQHGSNQNIGVRRPYWPGRQVNSISINIIALTTSKPEAWGMEHVVAPPLKHSSRLGSNIGLVKLGKMGFEAQIAIRLSFSWSSWNQKSVSHQCEWDGRGRGHRTKHGSPWARSGVLLGQRQTDTPLLPLNILLPVKKRSVRIFRTTVFDVTVITDFLMDIIGTTVH